jgi:hypothetical protein
MDQDRCCSAGLSNRNSDSASIGEPSTRTSLGSASLGTRSLGSRSLGGRPSMEAFGSTIGSTRSPSDSTVGDHIGPTAPVDLLAAEIMQVRA